MPRITNFEYEKIIERGVPTTITLASEATGGGELTAQLILAMSNQVYIGAPPAKVTPLDPNGATQVTLVTETAGTVSCFLFVEVDETDGTSTRRTRLVEVT